MSIFGKTETKSNNRYYRRVTRNMVANILVVALSPMLLLAGSILFEFNSGYKAKAEDHIEELLLKQQQTIDGFLDRQYGIVSFLAHTFGPRELESPDFLRKCLENLQKEYGPSFVDIGLVNPDGLQVAYAGPFLLSRASYAGATWFEQARNNPGFVSDVFLGLRGLPHFIVAVRKMVEGRPWILRATVDFLAFNKLVEGIRVGSTGFAYIINGQGEFQTSAVFGSGKRNTLIKGFAPQDQDFEDIRLREVLGPEEEKYVVATAPLKRGRWMLVYQQRAADAFAELNKTMAIAGVIIVLGAVAMVVLALVQARRIIAHLKKADREKARVDRQMVEAGRLAVIGELAAGIAHEINNPVAIMSEEAGWMQDMMQDGKYGREEIDEFTRSLSQIRTQGERCKEITHKLLHFARRTDTRQRPIRMNDVVMEIAGISRRRARFDNIRIHTDLARRLPKISASPSEMQQVLLNLINNARDAMGEDGGEITISTASELHGDKTMVALNVRDDGPGIARANIGKIFDPFFTTKPRGKGTGLGLSICYGIIKKMGGDILVDSAPDQGTEFQVLLPGLDEPSETDEEGRHTVEEQESDFNEAPGNNSQTTEKRTR